MVLPYSSINCFGSHSSSSDKFVDFFFCFCFCFCVSSPEVELCPRRLREVRSRCCNPVPASPCMYYMSLALHDTFDTTYLVWSVAICHAALQRRHVQYVRAAALRPTGAVMVSVAHCARVGLPRKRWRWGFPARPYACRLFAIRTGCGWCRYITPSLWSLSRCWASYPGYSSVVITPSCYERCPKLVVCGSAR